MEQSKNRLTGARVRCVVKIKSTLSGSSSIETISEVDVDESGDTLPGTFDIEYIMFMWVVDAPDAISDMQI